MVWNALFKKKLLSETTILHLKNPCTLDIKSQIWWKWLLHSFNYLEDWKLSLKMYTEPSYSWNGGSLIYVVVVVVLLDCQSFITFYYNYF